MPVLYYVKLVHLAQGMLALRAGGYLGESKLKLMCVGTFTRGWARMG